MVALVTVSAALGAAVVSLGPVDPAWAVESPGAVVSPGAVDAFMVVVSPGAADSAEEVESPIAVVSPDAVDSIDAVAPAAAVDATVLPAIVVEPSDGVIPVPVTTSVESPATVVGADVTAEVPPSQVN